MRTALFCWAYAKRYGGSFALRIEDTDQARSSEDSARGIMEDLAWCGIDWNEGPSWEHGGRKIGGDPRGVGSFYQSKRLAIYNKYVEQLIAEEKAYHAFDTAADLDAKRKAAVAEKKTYLYDRAGLKVAKEERLRRAAAGEPHVVRVVVPDEPVVVRDEVLGEVTYSRDDVDDFVIRKADGFPTYHFAVVVDDETMGVTHVLRGQEHLNNTPKHVVLQKLLGFKTPVYAHMPLIFNLDGSKMSKRDKDKAGREACKKAGIKDLADLIHRAGETPAPPKPDTSALAAVGEADFATWLGDKQRQLPTEALRELAGIVKINLPEIDVEDFRRGGYLPEVCCNYVALLGWNPGMKNADGTDLERFDEKFLGEHFSLERIGKTNSKFDRVKMLAFNSDAISAMSDDVFARRWRAWCEVYAPEVVTRLDRLAGAQPGGSVDSLWRLLARAAKPRARTLAEAATPLGFAIASCDSITPDEGAVKKFLQKDEAAENGSTFTGLSLLKELRSVLAAVEPYEPEAIEAAVKSFCEGRGVGIGKAAQPLRIALTGVAVSPALGDTCAILGRERVLKRIDRCLAGA